MIARFHYDDETFAKFLQEATADDQQEVAQHVETCEQCQARLETITQAGLTWEQAGELLRDDDFRLAACTTVGFLKPSEHRDSLGRFDRYEIMEILGRGGMGIVMRGFDAALNRHSAIKVLSPELASSAAARKRFSREAKSAAAVVHPHVVPIQTVDEYDGLPYLVMPVIEGQSLQQRVDQSGPLPIVEVVRIAAQIAEGLAAAHAQGLVHRDIKPANIMLENGVERVQITDFGLARAADDASMTRSGVIAGTPQYMSPEQAHGDEIDHRSDLFSLGSVIYFMLTGRSPFRAETTMGVLNRIANDEPRELQSINPDVPSHLAIIVKRLLAKSASDRYPSCETVAILLRQYLSHLQQPSEYPMACDSAQPAASSMNGGASRVLPWTLLAGFGALAIMIYAVLVFQTKDGTIRIETNGELANAVPLVIKQGDEVVQRLTVDSNGATTRVRAGEYSIEFDGQNSSFELKDNKAVVKANGVWTTRIEFTPVENEAEAAPQSPDPQSPDPQSPDKVRELALQDIQFGRYEEALRRIVWYWDNAVTIQPSLSAVRRSFLLSDWLGLGEVYPPAMAKLRSTRDELETRILSTNQVRIRSDDFADFAAINETLRQVENTVRVFEEIKKRDPQDAERVRFWLPKRHQQPSDNTPSPMKQPTAAIPGHSGNEVVAADDHTNGEVPLIEVVTQFNLRMTADNPNFDQPELTQQELVSCALWKLRTDKQLTDKIRAGLSVIAIERRLPKQWTIFGEFAAFPPNASKVKGFQILLIDNQRDNLVIVRRRYLSMIEPLPLLGLTAKEPQPNTTPLAAAITEFNAVHSTIDGARQPPLTIDEVLAAITNWQSRRDEAPIDNATFDAFINIAKTLHFPSGVKFELIPSFETVEKDVFKIWSVRIVLPQVAKPQWTYAFSIREQFISVDSVDSTTIHWGKPGDNGVQAGMRLIPAQREYKVGQKIEVEFFFRSITGKAIEASLPNYFTFDTIKVIDSDGNEVPTTEHQEGIIGGWMVTEIGEQPTRRVGQLIQIIDVGSAVVDAVKNKLATDVGVTVRAVPGQTYRLQFTVSNFASTELGPLDTGEVEFYVVDDARFR